MRSVSSFFLFVWCCCFNSDLYFLQFSEHSFGILLKFPTILLARELREKPGGKSFFHVLGHSVPTHVFSCVTVHTSLIQTAAKPFNTCWNRVITEKSKGITSWISFRLRCHEYIQNKIKLNQTNLNCLCA